MWGSSASSPAPWYSQDGEGPAAGGPGHPSQGGPAAVQQLPVAAAGGRAEAPGLPLARGCRQQQCQEEERAVGLGQAHGAAAGPAGVAGQPGHRPGACAGLASPHLTAHSGGFGYFFYYYFFFLPAVGCPAPKKEHVERFYCVSGIPVRKADPTTTGRLHWEGALPPGSHYFHSKDEL